MSSKIMFSSIKEATQPANVQEQTDPAPVLLPSDFSDVGQAQVFADFFGDRLAYTPATGFLTYARGLWEASDSQAQLMAQQLTSEQLDEANDLYKGAVAELMLNGGLSLITALSPKRAAERFDAEQARAYNRMKDSERYKAFAVSRRDSGRISATLREAMPLVEIPLEILDADPYLLNTPSGTVNLRTGEMQPHKPVDFLTRQTLVDPSESGAQIWSDALSVFFCNDGDLIRYAQEIAGLSAVGRVFVEQLVIAYGSGRNGKSSFWNSLSRVLGTYSGHLSADALTQGCRRNIKPELAELRGKRLVLAAELEEGTRLSTSFLKSLCSTDDIYAEPKYRAPFSFRPSHTAVLFTNYLPRIDALDMGTWRRLVVLPFNAQIEGSGEIKNFADYLLDNAGGAILAWIVEGARRVIGSNFKIEPPEAVRAATAAYRKRSDWIQAFLDERCVLKHDSKARSGEVYQAYREYCMNAGEEARSTTDFYTALSFAGISRRRTRDGVMLLGLQLS